MKPPLILGAAVLLAGGVRLPAADSVEVNGIARLGEEKLACLLVYQPTLPQPLSFTLAEGESRCGFKLLAVDLSGGQVLLEKCGVRKYLHINSAPDPISTNQPQPDSTLSAVTSPSPVAAPDRNLISRYLASDDSARILSGTPLLASATAAAAKNANNGQSAAPSPSNAGSNASNGGTGAGNQNLVANSAAGAPQTTAGGGVGEAIPSAIPSASPSAGAPGQPDSLASQLWYQESLSIEQSRVTTAEDVLSGKMEPFARTPLTPEGTPSQLVGQDIVFSDQIPGFKVTGYLNQ